MLARDNITVGHGRISRFGFLDTHLYNTPYCISIYNFRPLDWRSAPLTRFRPEIIKMIGYTRLCLFFSTACTQKLKLAYTLYLYLHLTLAVHRNVTFESTMILPSFHPFIVHLHLQTSRPRHVTSPPCCTATIDIVTYCYLLPAHHTHQGAATAVPRNPGRSPAACEYDYGTSIIYITMLSAVIVILTSVVAVISNRLLPRYSFPPK